MKVAKEVKQAMKRAAVAAYLQWQGNRDQWNNVIDAVLSLAPTGEANLSAVKPLEWTGDLGRSPASDDLAYRVLFNANGSPWGFPEYGQGYYVERAVGLGRLVSGPHKTRLEATASAQTDYERLILSTLNGGI